MNKTSDFIKLIDGVDQLQKYVQTNVVNIPVPQEAKEMFDDINSRLDSDTRTFFELTKDKTSPEQLVEAMSGIHLNLLKTNQVIKETFEFVNMVAGDSTPTKENFGCWGSLGNVGGCDLCPRSPGDTVTCLRNAISSTATDNWNRATTAANKLKDEAVKAVNDAKDLAVNTANSAKKLAEDTLDQAKVTVKLTEETYKTISGTYVPERIEPAYTIPAVPDVKFGGQVFFRGTPARTIPAQTIPAYTTPDQTVIDVPAQTCEISLKNPVGGIDCLKRAANAAKDAAANAATDVATGVFKKLTVEAGCPLDVNNILTGGPNNALLKYAECTKNLAVNKANQVANEAKILAERTANQVKDAAVAEANRLATVAATAARKVADDALAEANRLANEAKVLAERTANQIKDAAVNEANRLANVAATAARKVADDALAEARRLGKLAEDAASLAATESAKGVFKGLGLNNALCKLDENNILSGGRNNSLVKYAECMADVAKNAAVAETTRGLKTVFDNLGLNAAPCALDTNNIFTAGSGNALLKYAECRGNQAIDSLPKPTILGCEVSVRNIPAAVSCIENSAKNAVMGPISTIAAGFTSEMNNMLNKFKDLINMINGFGDTIWKFFQDIINTIKSQATLFIERINSEGGKILEKIKNEAGKVVSYVTTEGDRIVKYVLDQAGNIVKIITTQGNLVLEKVKDQAGNIITFITTESGKVVKTVTDTGGQMVAYIKDKSGEFVKVATSTAEKVISIVKDESGKVIKFVETSGGAIVKIVTDESGKIIKTVTDTGGKVVKTVSEKAVEFTEDASKFGKDVLDIVLEQGKKAYETIGEVGQSISESVSGIVDKIKEYTKVAQEIWGKIKEVGGMILRALWKGIVAVGRTIKWIIVNGPGWAMAYMKFWKKNLLLMRYNMPILIMMTVMIIGFVQTASYIATGTSQAVPLEYLFAGSFGITMVIANFFENIIRYLNQKIISNTIKQFVMTITAVTVLKVVVVDFLLSSALPLFVKENVVISAVIAGTILLGSTGYLIYSNYNKEEEPVGPGVLDDIKEYIQEIINTAKDIVDV